MSQIQRQVPESQSAERLDQVWLVPEFQSVKLPACIHTPELRNSGTSELRNLMGLFGFSRHRLISTLWNATLLLPLLLSSCAIFMPSPHTDDADYKMHRGKLVTTKKTAGTKTAAGTTAVAAPSALQRNTAGHGYRRAETGGT